MIKLNKLVKLAIIVISLTTLASCDNKDNKKQSKTLKIATTTSLRDSGILKKFSAEFKKETGITITALVTGTGKALKLGELGEVSALLVHAPASELAFVKAGHGTTRETFMENMFWIVGPKNDPANAEKLSCVEAFKSIQKTQSTFVSRNDQSGTHKKEMSLWKAAELDPEAGKYIKSGQGQGSNLIMCSEKQGYTLTDSATFLNFQNKLDLKPVITEDKNLRNLYSIIIVNPNKNDQIETEAAKKLAMFLKSEKAKKIIKEHAINGTPLFKVYAQ